MLLAISVIKFSNVFKSLLKRDPPRSRYFFIFSLEGGFQSEHYLLPLLFRMYVPLLKASLNTFALSTTTNCAQGSLFVSK